MSSRNAPSAGTLEPIFSPRSVAVIGASRNQKTLGYALLHNLVLEEFDGTIYPVNPKETSIHSLRCYPSVAEIPDPVDLAVILVPKAAVLAVVDQCLEKGVKGLVVITAGFREVGPEGEAEEVEIQRRVRAAGARMIGPNCMGVINADPLVRLNATFAPSPAMPGSVGFVSQSGALGVAILNVAAGRGIGFTEFASMGNKADVSGNDLLEFWEDDEATRVIAMYLESFGNPRKFTQIAKRVSRKKPILVVKSGRTEAGARAASSHTGAMAGADITVSAFLERCGVIRANTIEEMFDIAQALDRCPSPQGNRVAIVTNAGGPAIMATDACVSSGLEMTEFTPETVGKLRTFLPTTASFANPVDMIASAGAAEYRSCLRVVLADPNVDMVLAIQVTPPISDTIDVLDAILEAARDAGNKPIVVVMMATEETYPKIRERAHTIAVYQFPESAVLALSKLWEYARWLQRPLDEEIPSFETDDERVGQIIRDALASALAEPAAGGAAGAPGSSHPIKGSRHLVGGFAVEHAVYLSTEAAYQILEAYGIATAQWRVVQTPEQAIVAANTIGYPLVLKGVGSELVHKSDVGGVVVDLRNADELTQALILMEGRMKMAGIRPDGYLLQKLVRGGHEVIFGLSSDARLGPMLMFGLGGKYVEVFRDVRFTIPPLSRSEARDVVQGIRGRKLLEGVRGEKAVDLDGLADVLLRIAQLVERHPELIELDINPFLASPEPGASKAVDVRIRVAPIASDP